MSILAQILSALKIEPRIMLCTIISTTGSTPASAFSKMLVTQNGTRLTGTVGGGCMEADVLHAAKKLYQENRAAVLAFHLNENEYVQGLICGGSLGVLIEPMDATMIELFKRLQQRCEEGEDSAVATILSDDGKVFLKRLVESKDSSVFNGLVKERNSRLHSNNLSLETMVQEAGVTASDLIDEVRKCFHRHETRRIKLKGADLFLEPIAGTPNAIIFGGGHVSKFISQAAAMAGFRVTIVDDRESYTNPQRFPEAAQTFAVDFSEAFQHLTIKPSTYIIIVTRGHRYDEEILEQALRTPAKYIGMIGSKRKVFTTYEHLLKRGTPLEELTRVSAPMGLEIGAVTPEEIAISVVAQLTRVRRGETLVASDKSNVMRPLLERLRKKVFQSL